MGIQNTEKHFPTLSIVGFGVLVTFVDSKKNIEVRQPYCSLSEPLFWA